MPAVQLGHCAADLLEYLELQTHTMRCWMLRFSAKVLDDKLRQHGALGGVAWRELPWVLNLDGLPLHAAVLLQGGNHKCQRLLRSFFLSAYSLLPATKTRIQKYQNK